MTYLESSLLKITRQPLFAMVPISRINSWESWFVFNLRKNKHISHVPSTYVILLFQPYNFKTTSLIYYTVSHSYILYLSSYSLQHHVNGSISISLLDWTAFPAIWEGYAAPSRPLAWHGPLPWLGLPWFLLSTTCLFHLLINHTFKSPYNYYTSLNTSTHVGHYGRMIWYTYIYNLQPFLLLFSLVSWQVSWPQTLMSGTNPNDINFSSLDLLWAEQLLFKATKNNPLSCDLNLLANHFCVFWNSNCLAQDGPKDLNWYHCIM
jgi:hypothetical protein